MIDDLIRRSDAIEVLACEMYAEAQSQGYEVDSIEDFMPEAKAWMNDAPSADRPQGWIPCSERLPNENGDYLVTLENGVVKILGYSTTQRTTYPKGFYHIKDGFSWRQMQNPVVAWMPLPEPWKGADDDRRV